MVASHPRISKSDIRYRMKDVGTKQRRQRGTTREIQHPPIECLPQRRYILQPQLQAVGSYSTEVSDRDIPRQLKMEAILDSFNYFCLTAVSEDKNGQRNVSNGYGSTRSYPSQKRKRVVYPIASYTAHLNSKSLIEKRRRSLPHQFFRPVQSNI